MDLVVRVKEVRGRCPVYEVGDSFTLADGYRLVSDKPLCMHSLASLMPFYNGLRAAGPETWGIADREDPSVACVQCPDAAEHTGGGTVVLQVGRVPREKASPG